MDVPAQGPRGKEAMQCLLQSRPGEGTWTRLEKEHWVTCDRAGSRVEHFFLILHGLHTDK